MTADSNYLLNWDQHATHLRAELVKSFETGANTDVVLLCSGEKFAAHRVVLASCSAYFREAFDALAAPAGVIVLGVPPATLKQILDYMYGGRASVPSDDLSAFVTAAEMLRVSGLSELSTSDAKAEAEEPTLHEAADVAEAAVGPKRRKRESSRFVDVVKEEDEFPIIKSEPDVDDPLVDSLETSIDIKSDDDVKGSPMVRRKHKTVNEAFERDNLTCKICDKKFLHPYSLNHHMPVHTGKTKCSVCGIVLARKYNLKMHMRSRHNIYIQV